MSTSEQKFGITDQPYDTCPNIDSFLRSIRDIGEYDDDGDLIEIDPDYKSLDEAYDNIERMKDWQNDWVHVAQMTVDRLTDISNAFIRKGDDEEMDMLDNAFCHYFKTHEMEIEDWLDETKNTMNELKESIEDYFTTLDLQHSHIISMVSDNNEDSLKEMESWRSNIMVFRATGNQAKYTIKKHALNCLPDECNGVDYETQYEMHLDEIDMENDIKNAMSELNSKKDNNVVDNKSSKRNKHRL